MRPYSREDLVDSAKFKLRHYPPLLKKLSMAPQVVPDYDVTILKMSLPASQNWRSAPKSELCYVDDPTRRRPNCEMRSSFGTAIEAAIHSGIARRVRIRRELL